MHDSSKLISRRFCAAYKVYGASKLSTDMNEEGIKLATVYWEIRWTRLEIRPSNIWRSCEDLSFGSREFLVCIRIKGKHEDESISSLWLVKFCHWERVCLQEKFPVT
jgi:hypothetical protein